MIHTYSTSWLFMNWMMWKSLLSRNLERIITFH